MPLAGQPCDLALGWRCPPPVFLLFSYPRCRSRIPLRSLSAIQAEVPSENMPVKVTDIVAPLSVIRRISWNVHSFRRLYELSHVN